MRRGERRTGNTYPPSGGMCNALDAGNGWRSRFSGFGCVATAKISRWTGWSPSRLRGGLSEHDWTTSPSQSITTFLGMLGGVAAPDGGAPDCGIGDVVGNGGASGRGGRLGSGGCAQSGGMSGNGGGPGGITNEGGSASGGSNIGGAESGNGGSGGTTGGSAMAGDVASGCTCALAGTDARAGGRRLGGGGMAFLLLLAVALGRRRARSIR